MSEGDCESDPVLVLLDGSQWTDVLDFYAAMFQAIEAPDWHGLSPAALVDSMIWSGINGREPPYEIVVSHMMDLSLRAYVEMCSQCLQRSRKEFQRRKGRDVNVSLLLSSLKPH